jgi:hypothetical protein
VNKLQGFYELEDSKLPAVPWKKYTPATTFDDEILWTVRSAVKSGDDLNLPRKIGVTAEEAKKFSWTLYNRMGSEDLILYYPYFIALKSGVIEVSRNRIVIEAVKDDLWNLVTDGKRDVTIIFEDEDIHFIGNDKFLEQNELFELIDYCTVIKKKFLYDVNNSKSIFLEWSYACKSSTKKELMGNPSLLFYEIRTV